MSYTVLTRLINFCEKNAIDVVMTCDLASFFGYDKYGVTKLPFQTIDMAISIGGDGTLLGVCRKFATYDIPVCGINIGNLGFLADIEIDELENKLNKIISGNYHVEERLLLSGSIKNEQGEEKFLGNAINDVVVTKGSMSRMLHLGLGINDVHLMNYKADGIIVSSPTGSTAYSLSAGGPIMNPNIKALLLTPICAHTFNIRPLVVNENDVVHISIAEIRQDTIITFDGQESFRLQPGDEIIVRKSKKTASIVKFDDKEYYNVLMGKLYSH